jgi:hypothetical protein
MLWKVVRQSKIEKVIVTMNIKIENIWSRTKTFPLKVGHSTTRVLLSIFMFSID